MEYKIFYSWQSDLPNATNRGFIERALEKAARSIKLDDTITVEPVIERDTEGVPGSPGIAETIFRKIDGCHVFVCDVSIINQDLDHRPAPNPNVLIELGYALKVLGPDNIVMVMNTVFGNPSLLPFDLRARRVATYTMAEKNRERAKERNTLQSLLENALKMIIDNSPTIQEETPHPPAIAEAIEAINSSRRNVASKVRNGMQHILDQLSSIAPSYSDDVEFDDLLVESLDASVEVVLDYARISQAIAEMNSLDGANELYESFQVILENHDPPRFFSGTYRDTDFDFYKFIGHELFTNFIACLIVERRWELIADILEKNIYMQDRYQGPVAAPYTHIAADVLSLQYRNERLKLNRRSLQADLLNEFHTKGKLASIVSMDSFTEADFFLFVRSNKWLPHSLLYLPQAPRFLVEATSKSMATRLLEPLGLESTEEFRSVVAERFEILRRFYGPVWYDRRLLSLSPKHIASR